MQLKIITYNIHHGKDPEGNNSLDDMSRFLRVQKPALVCLNEADVYNPRSGMKDQPKWLGQQLKMAALFGPTMRFCFIGYGNALLSAYPARILDNQRLYSTREPRKCLEVEVLTPVGSIIVMVTHLGLSEQERERQISELTARIKAYQNRPIILAGDFNTSSNQLDRIRALLQDTAASVEAPAGTFPTKGEARRIDYIFCSNNFKVLGEECPRVYYSDHFPVAATLEIEDSSSGLEKFELT